MRPGRKRRSGCSSQGEGENKEDKGISSKGRKIGEMDAPRQIGGRGEEISGDGWKG